MQVITQNHKLSNLSSNNFIDFAVIVYPIHFFFEKFVQLHVDSISNGLSGNTKPLEHFGHNKAPVYVPNSDGSEQRLQKHSKNLFSRRC